MGWNDPANRPPAPPRSGHPPAPRKSVEVLRGRAGHRHLRDDRRRRVVDTPEPGAARRLATRAPRGRVLRPQAVRSPRRRRPALPAGPRGDASQRSTPAARGRRHPRATDRVGFAAATHPHDRDTFLVRPARSGQPLCRGTRRSLAHRQRRHELGTARGRAFRRTARMSACSARDHDGPVDQPGLYFGTSTGQPFASATRGRAGASSRAICPGSGRSRSPSLDSPWPSCTCPSTLPPLFAGLPRPLDLDAATVDEALDQLEERWPGCTTASASRGRSCGGTSTSPSTASAPGSMPRSRRAPRVDLITAIAAADQPVAWDTAEAAEQPEQRGSRRRARPTRSRTGGAQAHDNPRGPSSAPDSSGRSRLRPRRGGRGHGVSNCGRLGRQSHA